MDVKRVLHEELGLSAEDKGYWYILTALEEIKSRTRAVRSIKKPVKKTG